MKGSMSVPLMDPQQLDYYEALRLGARPGARPDRPGHHDLRLSGTRGVFDHAIADFAIAYASQNEQDYQRLLEASRPAACWPQSSIDPRRRRPGSASGQAPAASKTAKILLG